MKVPNFIDGREAAALGGYSFTVTSPFGHHQVELADSGEIDLADALQSARDAQDASSSLSFELRRKILARAAEAYQVDEEGLEHLVMMTGMPVTEVRKRLDLGRQTLFAIPEAIAERYRDCNGQIERVISNGGIEVLTPPLTPVAAFMPPNDPAEAAFIYAHAVMAGATLVLKPSGSEPYMALQMAKALTREGYPKGALNVVHWNTAAPRASLSQQLIEGTKSWIVMGDDSTIDALFSGIDERVRRAGKLISFSAGKAKALVDEGFSPDEYRRIAEDLIEGSMAWPLDCVATRAVVVVGDAAKQQVEHYLEAALQRRYHAMGDPRQPETRIGWVPEPIIDAIKQEYDVGVRHQRIRPLNGGFYRPQGIQMTPVLVGIAATDPESPFVTSEMPYTLSIVGVKSFADGVDYLNRTALHASEGTTMAIAVYTPADSLQQLYTGDRIKYDAVTRGLRTHSVTLNTNTMDAINPRMRHQGRLLFEELCNPRNVVAGDFRNDQRYAERQREERAEAYARR
ncbi:aldehyde dehydrogenase [Candidatus Woesearchaeota archaeon]|nr:aldehyde dehydrogenase [Candidatus Woesearchaeota archaeon]